MDWAGLAAHLVDTPIHGTMIPTIPGQTPIEP